MHVIMNQWRVLGIHPVWSRKLTLDICSSSVDHIPATICMACIIMQPHLNFKFLAATAAAVCLLVELCVSPLKLHLVSMTENSSGKLFQLRPHHPKRLLQ